VGCHGLSERLVRVKAWEEFKRLVTELKPDSLVYIIEQNGLTPTREMTVLRLILPAKNGYYVYLDFPKANALRETALPIHDNKGNRHLEDDDIKRFLKREFGENMPIFSYWTPETFSVENNFFVRIMCCFVVSQEARGKLHV
jgi:hypothetical protein